MAELERWTMRDDSEASLADLFRALTADAEENGGE
jgi:hypothetical protein